MTRIFSDLHFGHPLSMIQEVAELEPLFREPQKVVLNGDTWQELSRSIRPRSEAMLGDLQELAARLGTELEFLPGNHDPGWEGDGTFRAFGGRLIACHGDMLFPSGSPWKREAFAGDSRLQALWSAFPGAESSIAVRMELARAISREFVTRHHPRGRHFPQRVWDAFSPPRRALVILDAWHRHPQVGAEFLGKYFSRAETLVIGHFHRAGTWCVGGTRVINTGSFVVPDRPLAVDLEDHWIRLHAIRRSGGKFRIAETLGCWRMDAETAGPVPQNMPSGDPAIRFIRPGAEPLR